MTMPDGSIQSRAVASVGSDGLVTVASAFSSNPIVNGVVLYYAQDLSPITYKIIAKSERATGRYEISAIKHDSSKYALLDQI